MYMMSIYMKMQTFYEAIDDVSEKIINNMNTMNASELIELKSKILLAYQNTNNRQANYIGRLIKQKTFKISDDGTIIRIQ